MTKILPITPDDVAAEKAKTFPNVVIETWNKLIASKWAGGQARITQNEAVHALITATMEIISDDDLSRAREKIFKSGWLEIEDIYRHAGWKVVYDKSSYNESRDSFFVFSRK